MAFSQSARLFIRISAVQARGKAHTGEAEKCYQKAQAESKKLFENDYTETNYCADVLAEFYLRQKKYPQAEKLLNEYLINASADKPTAENYAYRAERVVPALQDAVVGYSSLLEATNREKEIEGVFQQYLKLVAHDYVPSEYLFKRAISISERARGMGSSEVAEPLHGLAHTYELAGRNSEAEQLYTRALAIYQTGSSSETSDMVDVQRDLAEALCDQKKYSLSKKHFDRLLALYREKKLPEDFDVKELLTHYATLLKATNHPDEALAIEKEAKSL